MFGMIFCCSSVIAAMATSTMAWYAAESSITVDPSSSSVTIRTPFQYYLYAYNDNGFDLNGATPAACYGTGYSTTTAANLYTVNGSDVPTYYTEVDQINHTSDERGYLTNCHGLWPGYQMSFAIKVTAMSTSDDAPKLKITGVTPGASATKKSTAAGNPFIKLAEAIEIKAGGGATLQAAVGAAAAKNYTGTKNDAGDEGAGDPIAITSNWWDVSESPLVLGSCSGVASYWFFYNIKFSNATSTFYSYSSKDASYEYYAKGSGNSSVYEGLTFSIYSMALEND